MTAAIRASDPGADGADGTAHAPDDGVGTPSVSRRAVRRMREYGRGLHPVGLAVALVLFTWSISPSLLPRAWYLQGVATGISVAAGYACTRAHHSDVGGVVPGSMPAGSTSIWQEGLIIPPVRLDDSIMRIILTIGCGAGLVKAGSR